MCHHEKKRKLTATLYNYVNFVEKFIQNADKAFKHLYVDMQLNTEVYLLKTIKVAVS